jgi:ABC-type Fe3+-hydroxamate transport system substrate-binding protein
MGARISGPGWSARLAAHLALVFVGAACAGERAAVPATIHVVDDAGDTVALARPATRVVSLLPAFTELVFALEAGGTIVGRTTWCDWPPEAATAPSVGDGLAPNVEAIVARRPDLVLVYRSGANGEAVARLRGLGITVVQFRADGLGDLARAARAVGTLLGRPDAGEAYARALADSLAAVRAPARREPLRALILVGDQPPIAIGPASYLSQLVVLAGGTNAFADLDGASAPVSLEAIAARDPDVVLVLGEAPPAAFRRPEWRAVRAIREGRVLPLAGSEWDRPGLRSPGAVRELAARFAELAP